MERRRRSVIRGKVVLAFEWVCAKYLDVAFDGVADDHSVVDGM
jgi:hypothetical protein